VNKTLGLVLVGLGVFGLAWGGFTYTTKERLVDVGADSRNSRRDT
jgi:hypothetical protein